MSYPIHTIPCTAHQERLWFIEQFEKGNIYTDAPVYHNLPLLLKLAKPVQPQQLENNWQKLAQQHSLLRTRLGNRNGKPVMKIHPAATLPFAHVAVQPGTEIITESLRLTQLPFQLENEHLFRLYLITAGNGEQYILLVAHHALADRFTLQQLAAGLLTAVFGHGYTNTENDSVNFTDFAEWQNGLSEAEQEPFIFYWKQQLQGAPVLQLDTDLPRAAIHIYRYQCRQWQSGPTLFEAAKAFCNTQGVSPFVLFQALFHLLFYHYSAQTEFVTGVLYANRDEPGTENMMGPAANLLPQKVQVNPGESFSALLAQTALTYTQNQAYAALPFEKTVLALNPENDMSRTALFDVMLHYETAWPYTQWAERVELNIGLGKYDLDILLTENSNGFTLHCTYNELYILPARVERLLGHCTTLLRNVMNDPGLPVTQLGYLTTEEIASFTTGATHTGSFAHTNIVQLFEKQVNATPENTALVFGEQRLSYAELNTTVNRLAHFLIHTSGLQPEEPVLVQLHRSEWLVIGLLAVLKAGGCYVPADPLYPPDRIEYTRADCGARIMLDDALLNEFIACRETYPDRNPGLSIRPEHLAYVIYTSGSTGQPKGVLVEHRNVVQLLYSHNPEYDFSASDAWLLFHSVCFDFSVWEMYGALLFGGKLVVPTAETVKDPAQCWQLVTREKITVFNQTPSAFYHFAREAEQQQWPAHHIRYVIFGGEALQPAQLANWFNHYPQTRLVNMFGITETTVHVTYKEITLAEITRGTSNIGRPLSTLYVYILDEHRQLLPAGIAGELYIGGAGLARGYLNREQLTAARFIPDPFKPGNRLYRSGDKARLTANGDLEYLGRADEQVKIRGYRIEPGEIETVLESHAQVKKAIVLAVTNSTGDSELVAFVTGCNETECEALRHYLGSRLPAYMLPAQIIALAYIPVTVNGKADKKALLQLKQSAAAQHTRFEPPLPGWENELALLWNKVLGVEPGRNDHFFHRGGHSLSAIQLQLLIKQQWNIAFNVAEIFMHPELAPLAERVRDAVHNQQPVTGTAIPQLGVQEAYAASPAQKRMWFLEQFQTGAYNVEIALRITGSPNMEKLGTALFQLVQRHEVLRTVFRHSTDVEQCILPGFAPEQIFQTEHTGITTSIEDVLGQRIARPFSLEEGPLFRATLFTRHEQEHILLLEIHHIIFDDWSAPILVTELLHFYNGNAEPLPALPVQYKEYAAWKLAERKSTAYTNAASFWKTRFAELPEPLELPLDFPRPRHKTYNGTTCTHRLNEKETLAIRLLCRQTGATFSQVGLALFKLLLYRYTGQYDLVTGMPIFERDHPQFEQLIGLFQNTLAVRIKLNPEYTLTEWIQEVSRETVQCYNHRIFPFDDLVEQLHLPRNLSRSPLFDVLYTHQLAGSYLTGADAGATISRVPLQPPVSPFDIVFSVVEAEHETQFSITANTDLFGVPKIERMLPHLLHLLQEMIAHPAKQVKQTACIGLPEWEQFPFRGENTHGITPIQQLWLQQLEQRPEQTALVYNGHSYSYREVFDTALAIAGALQQRGCRAEHRVGVYCTEKSHHAFVFAALLLMNACYLPIDMKLPEARRRFILEEARPYLLVTDDITTGTSGAVNEVSIHELLTGTAAQIPPVFFTGKEEAFIIYTSGTTGMPKGMMQTCSTISNLCTWMVKDINTRAGESFLQFAAVSFDAFVSDMAFAWAAGLTACIAHETERQDFNLLYRLLTEHRISVASLPYSVLRSFIAVTPVEELNALLWQRIVTYGEQLIVSEKFAAYLQAHPHIGLLNYYGPAETHVVTAYTHSGSTPAETYQPIGRPVANNEVYVLDNDGQPVPTGVTGLLYARGANVFNGYINSTLPSRKTRFAHIAGGEILFNTGDLARWQENGQLRYMGRRDQQIKINGNRVEIAEIEQCLLRCTGVQQAVVIPEKEHNGQLRLLGFYSGATTLLPAVLQQHLQQYLPVYMIPALLLPVPEFPVNKNGKIDKPALLAMVPQTTTGNGVAETFTPLQEALKTLWEEVLQQPVHTQQGDFFALGGHSLSASLLLNRIRETFRCKINIEHIFEYPQLGQMAAYIETAETAWYAPLPVQAAAGAFPLSPAQLGFWLKIQANPGSEAHHISAGFRVKEQPDVQVLEQAVQLLVNRHAALRTVFRIINGHVQQVVLPVTETRFRLLQQNGTVENVYTADVATWPLFQLQLNGNTTGAPVLFIAIHHLVCDGWSLEIFVQELAEIYTAIQKGNHAVLNPVKQYPDYAMWINRQPLAAAEAYWRQQLPFCTLQNNLRSYRQTEQVQDMAGSNVEFVLPVTENLRAFLQAQQLTAYHYVLAVMFTLLHRSGLEKNLLLAGVSAGRIHKDLEPMLGYFLNTYYLCVQVNAGNTFPAFCAQVKQQARAALQHQLLPFEKILEFLGEEKRLPTHRPLHETGLTYQKSRYGLPVARAEENGMNIIPEPAAVQQVKDPLWWYFTDSGTALRVDVHFATNVYTRTAIETLTRLYTELFNGLYNGNQLVTDTATQSHAQLTAAALQNLDEDF